MQFRKSSLAVIALSTITLANPQYPGRRGYEEGVGGASGGFGNGGYAYRGRFAGGDDQFYPPRPYDFKYEVNDAFSGVEFGHMEESDGAMVNGRYQVLMPDGRTQVVTYVADDQGYSPRIEYHGEGLSGEGFGQAGGRFGAPSSAYGAPGFGGSGPSSTYGAPGGRSGGSGFAGLSSSYGAPGGRSGSGFSSPSSSYGAPGGRGGGSGFGALSSSYGAPGRSRFGSTAARFTGRNGNNGFSRPSSTYGAPSSFGRR